MIRILAEYLGEDQMLAVVCRSMEAALSLVKYAENREIDTIVCAAVGKSIAGRFRVICLEGIRYTIWNSLVKLYP